MDDPTRRVGVHELNLASRKAEDAGLFFLSLLIDAGVVNDTRLRDLWYLISFLLY